MEITIPVSGDYTSTKSRTAAPVPCPFIIQHQKNGSKFIIHNMMLITMNGKKIQATQEKRDFLLKKGSLRKRSIKKMLLSAFSSSASSRDYGRI